MSLNLSVNADVSSALASIRQLESRVSALGSSFKAAFAAVTTGAVISFTDSITNLRNQLITLNDSQEDAARQLNGLASIAIRARSDIAAVGDLYYRTARAASDLGISQRDAARISETVAKALKMSGQSSKEAAGPLYQLGQAFQSGVFQGDELRSVLEGLGPVAKILADSMGVPVGALKKLGSEGQISAKQVADALLAASDTIDQGFGKTIPTISDSFNTFKNLVALAFNEFETNTKTAEALSRTIESMGFAIYATVKSLDAFIDRWGGVIVTIGKVILAFTAFRMVSALVAGIISTIGAFGAVVSSVAGTIVGFGARLGGLATTIAGPVVTGLGLAVNAFARLQQVVSPFIGILAGGVAAIGAWLGISKIGDKMEEMKDPTSEARKELDDYKKSFDSLMDGFKGEKGAGAPGFLDPKYSKELEKQLQQYKDANVELQRRLILEGDLVGASDREKTIRQALADVDSSYYKEMNRLVQEYKEKSKSKNKDELAALPAINAKMKELTAEYAQQRSEVEALTTSNYDRAEQEKRSVGFLEFSIKSRIDNEKKLRDLQDEAAKVTLPLLNQQILDLTRSSQDAARSQIDQENTRRRSLKLAEMTAEEEQAYYDEALKRLGSLTQAQQLLNKTKEAQSFRLFEQKTELDLQKQLRSIEDQRQALGLSTIGKIYQNIDISAREAAESELQAYAQRQNILRSEVPADVVSKYYDAAVEGANRLKDAQMGLYVQSREFNTGWNQALTEFLENSTNSAQQAQNAFKTFTTGFEDAIVRFVKTGKLSFKDLANDIIAQFVRIQAQNLLKGIFGSGGGQGSNIISSIFSFLTGRASGGPVGANTPYVVGERGPELFVPSTNGRIEPNLGGAGSMTQVVYNINATDAPSFKQLLARDPEFLFAVTESARKKLPQRSRR